MSKSNQDGSLPQRDMGQSQSGVGGRQFGRSGNGHHARDGHTLSTGRADTRSLMCRRLIASASIRVKSLERIPFILCLCRFDMQLLAGNSIGAVLYSGR